MSRVQSQTAAGEYIFQYHYFSDLYDMSRKYKFHNKGGLYFVSFATVYWIDLFVREQYTSIVIDSLHYSRKSKGLEIYCWCIMPSHLHLIIHATENNPKVVLGKFKEFTSKKLQSAREPQRMDNMDDGKSCDKPIELWSNEVIEQKVNYIHNNPVEAGFVSEPWHWKYSSAIDYADGKGLLEIDLL